jgi:hypothetical protein
MEKEKKRKELLWMEKVLKNKNRKKNRRTWFSRLIACMFPACPCAYVWLDSWFNMYSGFAYACGIVDLYMYVELWICESTCFLANVLVLHCLA